jgi:hypothetical protein
MPRILLNITVNNTPQQITGAPTFFRTASFFGISGFNSNGTPKNNIQTVYVGTVSGECPMVAAAGSSFVYNTQTDRERENLGNWFYQGTTGDGLYIVYN